MKHITDEMMKKLCTLATLDIDDEQQKVIKNDLRKMIEYIDIIKVESTDMDISLERDSEDNVLRKDEECMMPANESVRLIDGAPQKEGTYVIVPKTT